MHTDLYLNGCGAEPENNSRRFRVGTIYPRKDAHAFTHGNQDGTAYNTFLKGNVFFVP